MTAVDLQAKLESAEPAPVQLVGRTAAELLAEAPEQPDWLIPGVVARGWMLKVAAREKTGKGTLIFHLLGCLERGVPTVFGDATEPTTALIYTEEPAESVREKVAAAQLQRARIIYGYELRHMDWPAKATYLASAAALEGHGVVFVDNISRAAGVEDEAGTELARAAEGLAEAVRAAGLTTIVDHHHRKSAGRLEDKSRGGTALAGACDNNLELERVGDWSSRVRKVSSRGRLNATIWERRIALSEDGRTYELVADADEPQASPDRFRLSVLEAAGEDGITRAEFQHETEVTKSTAQRWLTKAVENGWAEVIDGETRRWRAVSHDEEPGI